MEIKKFLDARFLVPPIITIFFIWLANPPVFLDYIQKYQGVGGFLTGVAFIFALGFLLSSIMTAFVINLFNLRTTLSKESGDYLEKHPFSFLKQSGVIDKEITTWFAILDDKTGLKLDYIRDQIHKRWHAFNANLNSVAGLLFSFLIVCNYINIATNMINIWTILFTLSIAGFFVNARVAYQNVRDIDNIMVKRKANLKTE